MANRVRGVRQKLPPNSILTSGPGMAGSLVPARATSLTSVLNNMIQSGALPLPGSGLPSISSGDILSNITGSSARPIGNTLTATLDFVFGMAEGSLLQRGSSGWQVLTPGTAGYVLTSQGSGALLDWAAASVSFTYSGAWSGASAYSPGDVVTVGGSAYLCYSAVSAPSGGAIALDGSAGTTVGNGHSTKTVTLSTTKTNDVICVIVTAEDNTIGTVTSTVSSISDTAGLSWTKRTGQQGRNTSGGSGNDTSTIELWYAVSTAILTSDVITVNFAASVDGGCIIAFGINNAKTAAPFDVNASLPDFVTTGLSATISTTGSADMVVFVNSRAGFSGTAPTAPGGFTQITGGEFDNSGLSNSGLNVFYEITSAPLSGSTITSGIIGTYYPNMLADAFLQGTALNPSPATDDLHWLSQGAAGVPLITAVDSNFTVSGGTLKLATISDGAVIANISGSGAEPGPEGLSAVLDHVFGSAEGDILQRGASAWQVLAPGTSGQFLKTNGASATATWGTQFLTGVDSNFAVSGTTLELASIASGDVIGNSSAASAEPTAATLTAMIDRAFGSTEGQILQRGPSVWQVLAPASTVGALLQSGGTGALASWEGPGQIVGDTSGSNASAGNVGEYISVSVLAGSAVAMSSGVITTMGSITLSPGDWDIRANIVMAEAGSPALTTLSGAINTVNNAFPTKGAENNTANLNTTYTAGDPENLIIGPMRMVVTTNTVVYALAFVTFLGGGTIPLYGFMGARRMR